jgi:heme-degrading monooxygenase HmoA
MGKVFVIIWRYSAAPDRDDDFRSAYGPRGEWSRLFSLGNGYLGTELVQCGEPGLYITVDRWQNEADFDEFMAAVSTEYQDLDVRLSTLTTSEELIGRGSVAG